MPNKKYVEERQALRQKYMDLSLYPDEYPETFPGELESLRVKIKRLRYKSIRNFVTDIHADYEHGILQRDPAREVVKYLRGYRDSIEWEEISTGHQLRVNNMKSPWMSRDQPAEVAGYMAIRTGRRQVRILRIFDVQKFKKVLEE